VAVVVVDGGGNGDGRHQDAMEGAGTGSVNAKRSSRCDAACETQSERRDAENIIATRNDK